MIVRCYLCLLCIVIVMYCALSLFIVTIVLCYTVKPTIGIVHCYLDHCALSFVQCMNRFFIVNNIELSI